MALTVDDLHLSTMQLLRKVKEDLMGAASVNAIQNFIHFQLVVSITKLILDQGLELGSIASCHKMAYVR